MAKPLVAVDIDDVLAANAEGFVAYSNERWGSNLTVDDYDEHWGKVWKVDHDEVRRRAQELHETDIFAGYRHFEDAVAVLTDLKQSYRFVCATSRRRMIQKKTEQWLERHFSGVFETIHFAGIYDSVIVESTFFKTKSDILTTIGAQYLIDDQLKHCVSAQESGVQAILFGDYSWNRTDDDSSGIIRCKDWEAVRVYLNDKA